MSCQYHKICLYCHKCRARYAEESDIIPPGRRVTLADFKDINKMAKKDGWMITKRRNSDGFNVSCPSCASI